MPNRKKATQHLPPDRPLPLAGYIEISSWCATSRAAVTIWRKRYEDFPKPVMELKIGPVWWWPEVARWLDDTGRTYDTSLPVASEERGFSRKLPPAD